MPPQFGFGKDTGKSMEILNNEQILNLCLMAISINPEMIDSFPGEFLTYYVMKNTGKELSNEEIAFGISKLITGYDLNSLVNKGYLEANFDDYGNAEYTRTKL